MACNIKIVKFGKYLQGRSIFGKPIKSPITWYVLDKKDGKCLLLTEYCIERHKYHNSDENITWEKSTIRQWLNNENDVNNSFILNAFSENEIKKITATQLDNNDNLEFNTKGGNKTLDKIFLLSIDEFNKYLLNSDIKLAAPTKKSIDSGTFIAENMKTIRGDKTTSWWLRSPGYTQTTAMVVTPEGKLYPYIGQVNGIRISLRVAMWVKSD